MEEESVPAKQIREHIEDLLERPLSSDLEIDVENQEVSVMDIDIFHKIVEELAKTAEANLGDSIIYLRNNGWFIKLPINLIEDYKLIYGKRQQQQRNKADEMQVQRDTRYVAEAIRDTRAGKRREKPEIPEEDDLAGLRGRLSTIHHEDFRNERDFESRLPLEDSMDSEPTRLEYLKEAYRKVCDYLAEKCDGMDFKRVLKRTAVAAAATFTAGILAWYGCSAFKGAKTENPVFDGRPIPPVRSSYGIETKPAEKENKKNAKESEKTEKGIVPESYVPAPLVEPTHEKIYPTRPAEAYPTRPEKSLEPVVSPVPDKEDKGLAKIVNEPEQRPAVDDDGWRASSDELKKPNREERGKYIIDSEGSRYCDIDIFEDGKYIGSYREFLGRCPERDSHKRKWVYPTKTYADGRIEIYRTPREGETLEDVYREGPKEVFVPNPRGEYNKSVPGAPDKPSPSAPEKSSSDNWNDPSVHRRDL